MNRRNAGFSVIQTRVSYPLFTNSQDADFFRQPIDNDAVDS
jgi:hypothetical protein